MKFIRWLGAVLLLFWLISLVFRLGELFINILLLIAAFCFIYDVAKHRKNMT